MSSTTRNLAGLGLLVAGVLIGATGARAVDAFTPSFIETGAFTVLAGEEGRFFVSLHDRRRTAPVNVLLQIFDQDGAVVIQGNASLAPGKTTSISVAAPGTYRGHARILDGPAVLFSERRVVGTAQVGNAASFTIRPVCPVAAIDDSQGVGRPG